MSVIKFPETEKPRNILIGPFEEYRVVVDGRVIPKLTGVDVGDYVYLTVDRRFQSCPIPKNIVENVAWLIGNAMAIGGGYAHLGAESKERPFAPRVAEISSGDLP